MPVPAIIVRVLVESFVMRLPFHDPKPAPDPHSAHVEVAAGKVEVMTAALVGPLTHCWFVVPQNCADVMAVEVLNGPLKPPEPTTSSFNTVVPGRTLSVVPVAEAVPVMPPARVKVFAAMLPEVFVALVEVPS